MDIVFHKSFVKDIKKISPKIQKQAKERIELFLKDHYHPKLHFHALKGEYADCFSVNVNANHRIILYIKEDCTYLIRIGTHSQLYK